MAPPAAAAAVPGPAPVAQTPVAKPAPAAAPSTSIVAATDGVVLPPVAADQTRLEDTLAQLLRPMVRQWLDNNMQRALEKAVKIEMADSVISAMTKLGPSDKPTDKS